MKAHLGEKMSSSSLSYKDISILDAGVIQMAVSTVSNLLPPPTESFLVCRSLIGIHGSVRNMMRSGQYQLFSTRLCKIARQHSNTANRQNPNRVYFTLHFVSTY